MNPQNPGTAEESSGPGRWAFSASARTSAGIDVVWPLIGEAERWKEWSWMTRTYLLRPGAPNADGVGALRRFALGPGGSREEVVAWDPPHHLGYIVVSGLPVRRYRSDVDLVREEGETVVTWRASFDQLIPGTGAAIRLALRRMVGGFATRVCRYADGLDGGTTDP